MAAELLNSALCFLKPQANNEQTRNLVRSRLCEAGICIVEEGSIDGETVDTKRLIDQVRGVFPLVIRRLCYVLHPCMITHKVNG